MASNPIHKLQKFTKLLKSAEDIKKHNDKSVVLERRECRGLEYSFVKVIDGSYNVGWVLDFEATSCMSCGTNFSFLARRHHCRSCGIIVCNSCSPHVSIVKGLEKFESKGSRICNICSSGSKFNITPSTIFTSDTGSYEETSQYNITITPRSPSQDVGITQLLNMTMTADLPQTMPLTNAIENLSLNDTTNHPDVTKPTPRPRSRVRFSYINHTMPSNPVHQLQELTKPTIFSRKLDDVIVEEKEWKGKNYKYVRVKHGSYYVGWVLDSLHACMLCDRSILFRHHCRQCGKIVCNSCSTQRIIIKSLEEFEPTGSRVCTSCILSPPVEKKPSPQKYIVRKTDFELLLERLTSRDPTLTSISLSQNVSFINAKDGPLKLAKALLGNNVITDIDLKMTKLKDSDIVQLCSSFSFCKNLRSLNLESNYISSAGIESIASMMEKHPSLAILRLENQFGTTIDVDAERALINALSHNIRLTKLGYSFDRQGSSYERNVVDKYLLRNVDCARRHVPVIVPIEYPFPGIIGKKREELRLSEVEVPDSARKSVAIRKGELAKTGHLVTNDDLDPSKRASMKLDANGKVIVPESDFDKYLKKLRANDASLTHISFREPVMRLMLCSKEEPRHENFIKLCDALKNNTNVTSIDLYYLNMRDSNLIELCKSLSTCTELRTLNLEKNNLSTTGVVALADMLKGHTSLSEVKLEGQSGVIGPEAESKLVDALDQNPNITNLSYSFKDVSIQDRANRCHVRNRCSRRVQSKSP